MSSEEELKETGQEYKNSLKELTINSHPVIATLTTIAQENIPAAKYITDAITQRLNECIPSQKLYTLYLLDSVCKNIGSPYSILFAPRLSKIFIHCYTLVDNNTRKKMISLFKTWQTAKSSSGLPLFPAESLGKIDKFLIKATRNASKPSPPVAGNQHQNNRNRPMNQSQPMVSYPRSADSNNKNTGNPQQQFNQSTVIPPVLINQINQLQQLIVTKIPLNPQIENEKLGTLSQLKNVLMTQTLNPNDLTKISSDLQAIFATEIRELSNKSNPKNIYQQQQQPNFNGKNSFNNYYNSNSQNFNDNFNSNNFNNNNNFNNFSNNNRQFNNVNRPPMNTGNVSNVLSSLVANRSSNRQNQSNSITPIVKLSSNSVLKNILSKTVTKKNHDAQSSNLTFNFLLTNQNVQENVFKVDQALKFFYSEKSIKCNNCGKRFTNTKESQVHMDWHFRINKRLKESTTVCARSDYLTPEEFIEYKEDSKESAEDKNMSTTTSKNNHVLSVGNSATDNKSLGIDKSKSIEKNKEEHYVPVPTDSLDTNAMCYVCKDVLKGTWSDSKGEWLWMNAVKVDGKIYHWSCYKEASENIRKRPLENNEEKVQVKKQLV